MLFLVRCARRAWSIAALLVVVGACTLSACAQGSKLAKVDGYFINANGEKSPTFELEVCATDAQRSLGLMYRRSLASTAGMIFLFPDERENTFWMKNTYIPLDMVFVDKAMKVVGILDNVPPLNEAPRSVGRLSMYVLEFAAGTMKKHGVVPGATLGIHGELPQAR
jgi:uncharacterized membrane protein (UPF0127 family)